MIPDPLVIALKHGDETAFSTLVNEYQHMVYNTALGMVQSMEDAEDLSQEVFVQVYRLIQSFKGESKLSTWIYRITISKSLDFIKHRNRKKRIGFLQSLRGKDVAADAMAIEFHHPGISLDNKERSAVLFKAINKLPDNQKIAFVLNKVEGLSYSDVAEIMDCTVASVEAYLHRAKQHLRKLLADYYKK